MRKAIGRLGFSAKSRAKLGPRSAVPTRTATGPLDFWLKRKDLNYYRVGREAVQKHFPVVRSLLDLGGGSSRFLHWFPGVPTRAAADVNPNTNLYADDRNNIGYIVTDGTLSQFADDAWDVVTAFQMIEHCELSGDEILRIARMGIVVSYPYKWNAPQDRLHHNRDEAWFLERMGREPDYQTIVTDRGVRRNVTVFLKR